MDAARVRAAQRELYEAGEYGAFSATVRPIAEALVNHAAPGPEDVVLDVAAGDGVVSACVRQAGAEVVAVDISPVQLRRARARIAGLPVAACDAERLPFVDGTFDVVLSNFGAVLAPDSERVASELFRVCRPGGLVALTAWPSDSLIAEVGRVAREAAPDPAGFPDQELGWGDAATARRRFAAHADDVSTSQGSIVWNLAVRGGAGADDFAARYAAERLPGVDLGAVRAEVAARHTDSGGNLIADYLLVAGRRHPPG